MNINSHWSVISPKFWGHDAAETHQSPLHHPQAVRVELLMAEFIQHWFGWENCCRQFPIFPQNVPPPALKSVLEPRGAVVLKILVFRKPKIHLSLKKRIENIQFQKRLLVVVFKLLST